MYPSAVFTHSFNDLSRSLVSDGWEAIDTGFSREVFEGDISACYIFLCGDACELGFSGMGGFVGYVGMTTQLKTRMQGHEIHKIIPDEFYVQRWFLKTDQTELRRVESELIKKHNPPWNISGKVRGVSK